MDESKELPEKAEEPISVIVDGRTRLPDSIAPENATSPMAVHWHPSSKVRLEALHLLRK